MSRARLVPRLLQALMVLRTALLMGPTACPACKHRQDVSSFLYQPQNRARVASTSASGSQPHTGQVRGLRVASIQCLDPTGSGCDHPVCRQLDVRAG